MSELKMAIKQLMGERAGVLLEAKVKGVAWGKRECTVELADGRVIDEVRLRAVADGSDAGMCLKPKQNSDVLVGAVGDYLCVLQYTEVDAVALKMQDVELTIEGGKVKVKAEKWEFNGGNNKGMAVVDKIAARFKEIEKALNEIKTVFQSHTHQVTGIGTPTQQTTSPLTYVVPESKGSDFENKKVTH